MANQYLSRLGIVMGMDVAELEKGVSKAIEETKKMGREIKAGATAAQNEIVKLTYAAQDLETPLTAVAKVTREMNDPTYKLSKATQELKNEVLKAAAAYDLAAEKAGKLKTAQLNAAGQKAGLTPYQLQALSYQTTDIITSLAGGQNPMLVLLQQGGQLKDQFGGITNVFNAFKQVLTPLRVGLGAVAAVVGTLAYEAYKGHEAFVRLRDDLILTNGYAGVTRDSFNGLALALSTKLNTTIGESKTIFGALVASGKFTQESMSSVAEAIARVSKLSGESADVVAKDLIPAFNGSISSIDSLNQKYHFLTLSQYKYLEQLDKQGQYQLAAKAGADAFNDSLKKYDERLGSIEKLWRNIKGFVSEVVDGMQKIGAPQTKADKVTDLLMQLKYAEMANVKGLNQANVNALKTDIAKAVADLQKDAADAEAAAAKAAKESEAIERHKKAGGFERELALQTESVKQAVDDRINILEAGASQQEKIELETRRKLAQAAIDFDKQIKDKGTGLLPQEYKAFLEKVQAIESAGQAQKEELNRQQKKTFEDRQSAEQLSIDKEREKLELYQKNIALSDTDLQIAMAKLETEKNIADIMKASGLTDTEKEALKQRQESLGKQRENVIGLGEQLKLLKNVHDSVFNSMANAVETFVKTGKFAFKDFTKSVILDIFAIYAKAQMLKMLGGAGNFLSGLFSSGQSGTDFLTSGASFPSFGLKTNATGGSLPANSPSIVGERGAELFIPNTSGTIIPNNQVSDMMGGSTVVNNYNINAIDTQSFAQALASNKNAVFAANQSASRGLPASR